MDQKACFAHLCLSLVPEDHSILHPDAHTPLSRLNLFRTGMRGIETVFNNSANIPVSALKYIYIRAIFS